MPIYAECDICGKKYRFADDQAGLTVPCKECTADFDVIKPPLIDRKVLIGVGATIGAMLGLFIVAVVIVEIISTTRGPTPVAGTPTPAQVLPHSTATVNRSAPFTAPAIPNTSPALSAPPASTTLVPPANVPPNNFVNSPGSKFGVPANRIPSAPDPAQAPPVVRAFQPATITENGDLTIQGENMNFVVFTQLLSIRDPQLFCSANRLQQNESELSVRVIGKLNASAGDSELFVVAMHSSKGYAITVPKQVVDWQEGQPLPKDLATLVYVPRDGHRRVGAGHHMIFVETGATVDLDGTSGQMFLRPGARVGSANNVGMIQVFAVKFEPPTGWDSVPVTVLRAPNVTFSVVENLVRITKSK